MAVQAGLISAEDIIIDAKSGVSGAGRSAKQNLLYTEIAEGINCYGVGSHRHMPEIEQARPCLRNFLWTWNSGLYANQLIKWLCCNGFVMPARKLPGVGHNRCCTKLLTVYCRGL